MLFDRRAFLGTGSAALLAGCATSGRRTPAEGCVPLPPVRVAESRIIRTVAGLRPYRAAGFVVRREALGDKVLVHNYGHGGAGITLSWGSSRLAADLGLAGQSGPAAVIGAGAMGLTTARLLQEAGIAVTIHTAALPPDTTSAAAGGQVSPFGHFEDELVTPEWRTQFAAAMAYSWTRFQQMVGDQYGIRWLPTYEETRRSEPADAERFLPDWRSLAPAEHPFPVGNMVRYRTLYVETPRFLAQLTADFLRAGGTMRVRRFDSLAELTTLPDPLIFHCTGIGARELAGDEEMIPVRGQLAVLEPQHEVQYAFAGRAGYMFPRKDGVLLGGTFERGEWDATPQAEDIARIVRSHQRLFSGFRCAA